MMSSRYSLICYRLALLQLDLHACSERVHVMTGGDGGDGCTEGRRRVSTKRSSSPANNYPT